MANKNLPQSKQSDNSQLELWNSSEFTSPFDAIRHYDENGEECWYAREIRILIEYKRWANFHRVILDTKTHLAVIHPSTNYIIECQKTVQLGDGLTRQVVDYRLYSIAIEALLRRCASYKPVAAQLANNSRLRVETTLIAALLDFCETAGLSAVNQFIVADRIFDLLIGARLLIEIDEGHHKDKKARFNDRYKDWLANSHGYQLLRVTIPTDNIASLLGAVTAKLYNHQQKLSMRGGE